MSLINEALKKAQRQRSEIGTTVTPPMPGGAPAPAARHQSRNTSSVLLLAGGAGLLVVVSVVATTLIFSRSSAEEKAPAPAPPPASPPPGIAGAAASPPIIQAPIIATPEIPVEEAPLPAIAHVAAQPAHAEPKPDARIYAFVDGLRVTGVRAAGDDSRVLMNGQVYRRNDIVERAMGLRLIAVEAESLTFTDSQGAVYVKNF